MVLGAHRREFLMLGVNKNPGNVLKDVASQWVSFKAMVVNKFGVSETRCKRHSEENQGKFQEGNKIKRSRKGKCRAA